MNIIEFKKAKLSRKILLVYKSRDCARIAVCEIEVLREVFDGLHVALGGESRFGLSEEVLHGSLRNLIGCVQSKESIKDILNGYTEKKERLSALTTILGSHQLDFDMNLSLFSDLEEFCNEIAIDIEDLERSDLIEMISLNYYDAVVNTTSVDSSFSLDDLFPKGLSNKSSVYRSIVGSALDANRLSGPALTEVRYLYPDDRYIQKRTMDKK